MVNAPLYKRPLHIYTNRFRIPFCFVFSSFRVFAILCRILRPIYREVQT